MVELVLEEKDAGIWIYRGEGGLNIVLAYIGSSPNFFLIDVGLFESKEEAAKREDVLGQIKQDLDISNDSVLYDADKHTVRSLNDCRVADQILKHVPNVEV
ncbi:hypothetical protein L1887_36408 [Cichorium endivia]|nr:hypothetical protein L1887_36408 [Cichorium endivia]